MDENLPIEGNSRLSVNVVMLAAGSSRRMKGYGHKLLARFEGVQLLRKSVLAVIGCDNHSVVVVFGDRHKELEETVADLRVRMVYNPDYMSGMASSIRVGVIVAQENLADGILIGLGDMPALAASDYNLLIAAFREHHGQRIIRAVADGKPGNPVVFPSSWMEKLKELSGDVGARDILKQWPDVILDAEIGHSALIDVDTGEDLIELGGTPLETAGSEQMNER